MDKKSFFKGLGAGILAVIIFCSMYNVTTYTMARYGKTDMTMENKLDAISTLLDKYYVDEIDKEKMTEGVYSGLVDSLGDVYTTYMSKDELTSFLDDTEGKSFHGIGVEVTVDPSDMMILILSPILGGPAEKAGILPGDKIIAVDAIPVSGDKLDDAVSRMKGEKGTNVTLTIYRQKEGKTFDVKLTRDVINDMSVTHKMLDGNIGYIRISQFKSKTYDQFMEAYNALNAAGQKGLVIDVRNNPGGLFDVVGKIVDELVPEGTYVYTVDKQNNRKDSISDSKRINIPLCLLVNGSSASASEILSGAVQDMGVGKLVGTQTYGKGLVQGIYPLSDGSGLKITIQKYYTPKGVCIQGEGIKPDYIVELPDTVKNFMAVDENEDTQLKKAVEVINSQLTK